MKLILSVIMLLGLTLKAHAAPTPVLECAVPAQTLNFVVVLLKDTESVEGQEAVAFVIYNLKEDSRTFYYTVQELGKLDQDLAQGSLELLAMGENFSQEDGILKDVASLSLSYNAFNEIYIGTIAAGGNQYPIMCLPAVEPN